MLGRAVGVLAIDIARLDGRSTGKKEFRFEPPALWRQLNLRAALGRIKGDRSCA
jgi:hypothetical protein